MGSVVSTPRRSGLRKRLHLALRRLFALLPREWRFTLMRRMVDCDPAPPAQLQLKIAETREELEACFKILHDAYVAAGYMKPDPSGLRVTLFHALPTTTTLCAKWDGQVVGTISMIRDGVFGFPLQSVFDLSELRSRGGQIAEISALAVHPSFRKTGGAVMFPLMKFMRDYCATYFDTRHLVIAVNPDRIEMYEALLCFSRLQEQVVEAYAFANGAPAVGATLDLHHAPAQYQRVYGEAGPRKHLGRYFFEATLANIQLPKRRYYTTNDPVMTPELLDHFFNQRTQTFAALDDRKKALLWSIYQTAEYRRVLPMLGAGEVPVGQALRRHQRHSIRCPGHLKLDGVHHGLEVIELSLGGFQARCPFDLQPGQQAEATVQLGQGEQSTVQVTVVRKVACESGHFYGLRLQEADPIWRRCVAALESGHTAADLDHA